MKTAQLMGVAYALGRQVLIPILTLSFIGLAFYKVGRDPNLTPCVINTIGKGKVQYLNCDPKDLNANKEVLVDTTVRALNVLYNYNRDGVKRYASQYEQFKHFISSYSPAASSISNHVLNTIGNKKGPISLESSNVTINYDSFQSILENEMVYVTVDATRKISRPEEPVPQRLRVDIIYKIGGGKNEIYHIFDYTITSK